MSTQTADSQRIKKLLEYLKISANKLSKTIGLQTPQVFYDIKAGKCGISKDLARRIQEKYLNIDAGWLLTGAGEMIIPELANQLVQSGSGVNLVPVVDLDLVGSVELDKYNYDESGTDLPAECSYRIPYANARPGDLAIIQYGDSMSPVIPAGAFLLIRQVVQWKEYLGYGNDFVLKLSDGRRLVKKILCCNDAPNEYLLARSYNPEVADERIPIKMITGIWKIVTVTDNKGW